MKLSVSLPASDVDFLDAYSEAEGLLSRSAALQRAVRLLKATTLGDAYRDAWVEWQNSGDEALWAQANTDDMQR